jgi:ATP-binding cassette subfamily B protein
MPLLERMPGGLSQLLGESGWQLSHGERSRVFIARALLQDPQLLILDESLGALDPETHQRVLQAVVARSRSLIIVAHP